MTVVSIVVYIFFMHTLGKKRTVKVRRYFTIHRLVGPYVDE